MEKEELKRKNKLDNLITFITSNLAYTRYLESYGIHNELSEHYCDLNILKITYSSFLLLLWKDEYIKKNEFKQISGELNNDKLDIIVSEVASKNEDNTWNIGNINLNSNYEVIDKIRNKIAHGDYIIINDEIEIENENQKGRINIDKLSKMSVNLGTYWEQIKIVGENKYGIIKGDPEQIKKIGHINNSKDLKRILNNMYYVEIKDHPKLLHQRNDDYRSALNDFKNQLIRFYKVGGDDDLFLRVCKPSLSRYGIEVELNKTKLTDIDGVGKLYSFYEGIKEPFNRLDLTDQLNQLGFWVHEISKEDMEKKIVSYGIISNLTYLRDLTTNKNQDIKTIIEKDKSMKNVLERLSIKNMITAYLTNFYAVYMYGLDGIYADEKREHITNLFNNKMFDYSQLDLSRLNITKIDVEKQFEEFEDHIKKLEKDAIENDKKYDEILDKADGLKNYLKNNYSEEKAEIYQDQLTTARGFLHKSVECAFLSEEARKFMENDFENYKFNRSVIEHIRNSIAHGNVRIDTFAGDGTIGDTSIEFKDIHEGKETFAMKTSLEDFLTLFDKDNLDKVYNYINKNTTSYNKTYQKK